MNANIINRVQPFNGENFASWKPQMEAILNKARLSGYVKGTHARPAEAGVLQQTWDDKDMDARAELILAMEPNIISLVKDKHFSHEIWTFLGDTYDRRGPRQKAEEFRRLINIKMEANQSMGDFIREFKTTVSRLLELEATLDKDLLVVILLDGLSDEYKDVQAAFDAQSSYPELDIVCTRLLEVSDRKKESATTSSTAFYSKGKFKPKHFPKKKENSFPYDCRKCGKRGHKAKDCFRNNERVKNVQSAETDDYKYGFTVQEQSVLRIMNEEATWCVDSGATSHMCSNRSLFQSLEINNTQTYASLANGNRVSIVGIGTAIIPPNSSHVKENIKLFNTLYIPDLKENLISVGKATERGFKVTFEDRHAKLYDKSGKLLLTAEKKHGLFLTNEKHRAFMAAPDSISLEVWHKRMGHLNLASLKQMHLNKMVTGLPKNLKKESVICDSCICAKQSLKPFSVCDAKRSSRKLELIHSDVCGPMRTESLSKSLYFITFIDDFTRHISVYFMRKKSEALDKFKAYKAFAEKQMGESIKSLRSDNGTEYTNGSFENYLEENGIAHELSAPYTPQQNGIAERANRTLLEMARCLKLEADLPDMLWAELICTAAFIRNRCPTKLNGQTTPEELWTGKRPDVAKFRCIGTRAYVLDKGSNNGKFDPKSTEHKIVGYENECGTYRLWKPGTRLVTKSRDVKFVEVVPSNKRKVEDPQPNLYTFNIEPMEIEHQETKDETKNEEKVNELIQVQHSTGQFTKKETLTEELKTKPECSYSPHSVIEGEKTSNAETDPTNLKQLLKMENRGEWFIAMEEEYQSLMRNDTWELVDRPADRQVIKCKWVFKTKFKQDGSAERRKARLVAKGYEQIPGLDYTDTFAPVASIHSIRLTLAIAAEHNLQLHHLDVSSAYLNGELDTQIFMEQPEAFQKNQADKVCLLKKAIYGLKQSGRQWNLRLDKTLKEFSFLQSSYDRCIYYKTNEKSITIMTIYVDDILLATNDHQEYLHVCQKLSKDFGIRDLGEPKLCVGLEISRSNGDISINQTSYINNLQKLYQLEEAKPSRLPAPVKMKLQKNPTIKGESESVDKTFYRQLIGRLLYISTFSRPDISFIVNALSQYVEDPRRQHWTAGINVIRYLLGTKSSNIIYRQTNHPLQAYSDSSWAGDVDDRKSQSGFVFIYAGGAVHWSSRKQRIVATSSTEAEYITLSSVAKEAAYLRNIMIELKLHDGSINIYCDNQSAKHIANDQANQGRTKHIDVRYHFVREAIANNIISISYLRSEDMIADALTKALPNQTHYKHFADMGMIL